MSLAFKGSKAKVCVALKFNDAGRRTLLTAEQVCRRTGAAMHLVHIQEDVIVGNLAGFASNGIVGIPADVIQLAQESAVEEAEKKMMEFAKLIRSPIKVSTKIYSGVLGSPSELIEAEAMASQSTLIAVGASPGTYRFVPKGLSCALSLMSRAKLPVMVINTNEANDFSGTRLQMVIADDLKPHGAFAVVGGCKLAFAFGDTDIHHIHINGLTAEALSAALNTALAASHSQPDLALSVEALNKMVIKHLENLLEQRTVGMNIALEISGCKYYRSLLTADSVTEKLGNFVKEKNANVVVFGRHQAFYRKPFGMGQMPYYAMLALPCPVVVFPESEL